MNAVSPPATPRWRRVFAEQVRAVGFNLRGLALGLGGVLVVGTGFLAWIVFRSGEKLGVSPEILPLLALAAPLLPLMVWKGEYNFRQSYLATMPVNRSLHVWMKIVAGWGWLMIGILFLTGWIFAFVLVIGGPIGVDEMRLMAEDVPSGVLPADVKRYARHWTTPLWSWAVLFTAPTLTYLVGNIIVLVGSRVRRWLAGLGVVTFFFIAAGEEGFFSRGVERGIVQVVKPVLAGDYGLVNVFLLSDADGSRVTAAGEQVTVWMYLPTFEAWALSTLLWGAMACLALLLVVWHGRRV